MNKPEIYVVKEISFMRAKDWLLEQQLITEEEFDKVWNNLCECYNLANDISIIYNIKNLLEYEDDKDRKHFWEVFDEYFPDINSLFISW